jgi:RNA polymerase sigma-70 factor (ECF subfamily)
MMVVVRSADLATPEPTLRNPATAEEGFSRLLEVNLDRSYRIAGLILGDAAEAEDAVGDAIERAWAHAGQLRDPARFQAWFDRILVNTCRDRIRRRSRLRFIRLDGAFDSPDNTDPFRRVIDGDEMLRSVEQLSVDERVVVVLHYWADLTLEAIAERLGWRIGTVKSRLHRALARLRTSLSNPEAEQ